VHKALHVYSSLFVRRCAQNASANAAGKSITIRELIPVEFGCCFEVLTRTRLIQKRCEGFNSTRGGEMFSNPDCCHLNRAATSHQLRIDMKPDSLEISCPEVWKDMVNYTENDLTADMRERIDKHLRDCAHCRAIYDGSRNVVRLLGGEHVLELPLGFSQRLYERICREAQR
jgi:Putative zinc-finger